jgi:hypothetical protein
MGFVLVAAGVLIKGVMGQIFALAGLIVEFLLILFLMIASFMKWDISAKKEIFIPLDAGHIPRKKIKETLESIGCHIVRDQKTDIAGYIGPKILSWGEMISVVFVDAGMKVQSECVGRLFPQAMDWGKNRRNLTRFEREWEKKSN